MALSIKKWVVVAIDAGNYPLFTGVGNTSEEANLAMYMEALEMLNEMGDPDNPPKTIELAKSYIEDQMTVIEPFEVDIKL